MKIVCIGGGPAGLYLGILVKRADPTAEVTVIERNRPDDTFGFGVVFSDATLGNLAAADPESYAEIERQFAHWDDIDTHVGGRCVRSTGHGFCGLGRMALLAILQRRCEALGVELQFETEIDDPEAYRDADLVVGADGVASLVRDTYSRWFEPELDMRPNRFVWLGTSFPFEAFTFYFKRTEHGLFRVHAYRYQEAGSTFIVECTEATWRAAELDRASEDDTIAYLERAFADELAGHRLIKNRSIWRQFPTVRCARWHHDNVVLVGDAAHTAHFSIGSGTKLAMEDCIALAAALAEHGEVPAALAAYDRARRPQVEGLQRAAQVSLEWFEHTEWYTGLDPLQFTFSLLTRSLRVTHGNLARRDPALVARVDRWYADRAAAALHGDPGVRAPDATPPMFAPLALRDLVVANRIAAAPIPLGAADDGAPGALHAIHHGARAIGGVGLLWTEPCAVVADGRADSRGAGLWDDAHVAAWRRVLEAAREHAPARVAVGALLGHAGDADLESVRDAYTRAADRALRAGFDLVSVDIAGGGLLHRAISPLGGDPAAGVELVVALVRALRARLPDAVPLCARLAATDWAPGGIAPESAVALARALRDAGCDLIEVTGGGLSGASAPSGRLVGVALADRLRNLAGVPTAATGAIASYDDVNSVLAAGRADMCTLGRALVHDPHWVRRAARAQGVALPWPAPYAQAAGFTPRD